MSESAKSHSKTGSTFDALRVRDFRLYFFGQICSISGSNAQTVAMAWLTLQLTDSATMLGLVTAAQFLPMVVVSPFLGSLIDRAPKRSILIVAQLLAMSMAVTLGILSLTNHATWLNVCLIAFLLRRIGEEHVVSWSCAKRTIHDTFRALAHQFIRKREDVGCPCLD